MKLAEIAYSNKPDKRFYVHTNKNGNSYHFGNNTKKHIQIITIHGYEITT